MTGKKQNQLAIVSVRGITKIFSGIIANKKIDLDFYGGEVHAVLGENGAGKSTLMKIISGAYRQDEGTILVRGKEANINSPRDAFNFGIGMVHQHFIKIDSLSVIENIILGLAGSPLSLDIDKAKERVSEISKNYGLEVPLDAKVGVLPIGLQQRVEILRLLYRNVDILIFDEPTAFLTPQESERLGKVICDLASEGRAIIYITHKLKEVFSISDVITVMRAGAVIGTLKTSEVGKDKLVQMMIGERLSRKQHARINASGKTVLQIKNLTVKNDLGALMIKGLNLDVKAGEILGIAGVSGNGQQELAEVIIGLRHAVNGEVLIGDQDITSSSPLSIIEAGVSYVPGDRMRMGLIPILPVRDNLILKNYRREPISSGMFLKKEKVQTYSTQMINEYGIKVPDVNMPIQLLSGGNQQKVILARELNEPHKLLIVEQPTRGLDVRATRTVHQSLLQEREKGSAILLISADMDEILNLSDRIAVIYEGQIVSVVLSNATNIHQLGLLMTGRGQKKWSQS
jgi:general nucleoside transport system ATP-binding protein